MSENNAINAHFETIRINGKVETHLFVISPVKQEELSPLVYQQTPDDFEREIINLRGEDFEVEWSSTPEQVKLINHEMKKFAKMSSSVYNCINPFNDCTIFKAIEAELVNIMS